MAMTIWGGVCVVIGMLCAGFGFLIAKAASVAWNETSTIEKIAATLSGDAYRVHRIHDAALAVGVCGIPFLVIGIGLLVSAAMANTSRPNVSKFKWAAKPTGQAEL